jgi:phosphatidylinositol-3-phosphatase
VAEIPSDLPIVVRFVAEVTPARIKACGPAVVALLGVVALAACGGTNAAGDVRTALGTRTAPAARSHVVVLVMENKEQGRVIGSHGAPFLNRLARRGGVATQSFGVRHPSLPNYIALISGSTQGITDDCTDCTANGPNIADQLEAAHRTWGAYLGGLPRPCARPASAGRYAKKHDPFAYDDRIAASPARCRARVPLRRLEGDILGDRLPDFVFIAPDLCDDTHDCAVRTGDRFLARVVPALLSALGPHGFLVVTYDEGDSDRGCCGGSHGGHIATVLAGPDVRRAAEMTRSIDHYGVLASVEQAFGLPRLGSAADPRHGSLAPLFRGRRVPRV